MMVTYSLQFKFLRTKAATAFSTSSPSQFSLSVCPSVTRVDQSKTVQAYDHQIFTISCVEDSSFRISKAFS